MLDETKANPRENAPNQYVAWGHNKDLELLKLQTKPLSKTTLGAHKKTHHKTKSHKPASSIDKWLQSIGLEVYASKIKDYGCDSFRVLDDASEQDMENMTQDLEIGMKKLHRIFFMKAWNQRAASHKRQAQ